MSPRIPVLFVTWRSPKTHSILPVGRLIYRDHDGLYEFAYINKVQEAVQQGFMPFLDFPFLGQFYLSHQLFPLFANRVLPINRPEFREYTRALGLSAGYRRTRCVSSLGPVGGEKPTRSRCSRLPVPDPHTGAFVTHCLLRGHQVYASTLRRGPDCRPQGRNDPLMLLFGRAERVRRDRDRGTDPRLRPARLSSGLLEQRKCGNFSPRAPTAGSFVERVNPPPAGVHHRLLCRVEGCWPAGYIPFSTEDYQPHQSRCHGHRAMAQDPDGRCVREYLDDGFRVYHTTHQTLIPPRSV